MTDGSRSSTLSMSERSRGTGTLSRRWKAFLTRIRSVGRASKHWKQQEEEEESQGTQEESKPRLSTESVIKPLPTFTDTPKRTAHHVSMPAGPVASALSPPPRHTMTKHTSSILERSVAIEQQKGDRPTQMRLRLSLDVEQHRQSSILCTSPSSDSSSSFKRYDDDDNINTVEGRRPSLPFRSGTLGTVKSDRLHTDMPPLPLPNPALLTSSASVSSNETLRERRRRRSPLSLPGEEQLTISLRSSLSVDDDTSLDISRQRAMHALEGKVVKMEPNASPSHLSADALARDKAEYDAVVARTILRRTPHELTPPPSSSSTVHHHNQPTLKAPELPSSPNSVFTATVVE